jgi:hypothetical protein
LYFVSLIFKRRSPMLHAIDNMTTRLNEIFYFFSIRPSFPHVVRHASNFGLHPCKIAFEPLLSMVVFVSTGRPKSLANKVP